MGVRQRLTALSLRRVHVLVVEVPGWFSTRVAAQQQLSARGWGEASSPADADVLLVCGAPGERLEAAVQQVWCQLPGPRAREWAETPADVADALDRAVAVLADTEQQRRDAGERHQRDDGPDEHGNEDASQDSHEMSDMDHGDMDHGDMEMAPGGIPLAGGGEDRDGLEMDVLQVPLGPVLPCWPAGLVLRCSLQGDVVVAAEVEVMPAGSTPPALDLSPETVAARLCDQARQVLELSGWVSAAQQAGRVGEDLLTGAEAAACLTRLRRLTARVERSRLLRWSLRDLGRSSAAHGCAEGPPVRPVGDVHDRLLSFLRSAGDLLDERPDDEPHHRPADQMEAWSRWTGTDPHELPEMVTGLDLAAVRLVVASAAPHTATAGTSVTAEVSGG